jgi:peroxiredoxin
MPVLSKNSAAPEIKLKTARGEDFSLDAARRQTPVVAAFFKVECPTCQYALPFVQRLSEGYPKDKLRVVAISQNDKAATEAFIKQYKLDIPVAIDDKTQYVASNAYGLTNVPSIFYISTAGKVEASIVGWSKSDMDALNTQIAKDTGAPIAPLYKPTEQILEFKAG